LQAESGISFASANSKKELRLFANQYYDFVYLKQKGQFFLKETVLMKAGVIPIKVV